MISWGFPSGSLRSHNDEAHVLMLEFSAEPVYLWTIPSIEQSSPDIRCLNSQRVIAPCTLDLTIDSLFGLSGQARKMLVRRELNDDSHQEVPR
jgi:hypothetical protein